MEERRISQTMRKVLVLYNPASGGRTERRQADVEAVLNVLRKGGWYVSANVSGGTEKAAQQAREAVANGYDTVLACGGDGTIHDVLQGLAGSQVALGVIPMGTANALAHDLKIPLHPVRAAECTLTAVPRRFALGRVEFQDLNGGRSIRFFTVAVGVGVDAHLFYKLNAAAKSRAGMAAYYAKATHLWFTHPMKFFQAELQSAGKNPEKMPVTELLAVRIAQFGGVLREFVPGANLANNDLRLVLFQTSNRLRYLAYIFRGLMGSTWCVRGVELRSAERVYCRLLPEDTSSTRIYVEADGELVGMLPAEISMVPDGLSLLVPRGTP